MSIYSQIKSPIDTKEGLRKIVDAYLNEGSRSFYGRAVSYGENKNQKFNETEFEKFKHEIERLDLERLRRVKEKDVKKYRFFTGNSPLAKLLGVAPITKHIIKSIKMSYPNYNDYKILEKYSNKQILDRYHQIQKTLEKSDIELSGDDLKIWNIMEDYVTGRHKFNYLAGFHVYEENLEEYAESNGEKHYKIYLNLDYDHLYRFALKFMEVCRAENIPYCFKVMSPLTDSPNRSEKMCIYCDKDEFYKVIDIIRAIKRENPQLRHKNPPILAGILDGWIGIGSDGKGESYNRIRSGCIEKALDNYFKGISRDTARKMLKQNPQMLDEIREEIIKESQEKRVVANKYCFTEIGNGIIKEEANNYSPEQLKMDYRKLVIPGIGKKGKKHISNEEFNQYVNVRNSYGENSLEVKNLCKKIARIRKIDNQNPRNNHNRRNNGQGFAGFGEVEDIVGFRELRNANVPHFVGTKKGRNSQSGGQFPKFRQNRPNKTYAKYGYYGDGR